jgi:DHA1 family bicyclomycin/chloramphenicol resistance-like MFS transporter
MVSNDVKSDNELGKFGILTLVMSRGLTMLPAAVVSLLLVDIAISFNVEVGFAGQVSTAAGIMSILFGLVMGALSVRFKHKSLLFTGILLFVLVAISAYFSTSVSMLIAVYALVGVANTLVIPMVHTIIGEFVSPDRRASVIGITVGGMFLIYLLGMLSVGLISNIGWRLVMVIVVVPVGVLVGILCRYRLPEQTKTSSDQVSISDLFRGYMKLLRNKSAIGCILGTLLGFTPWYFYVIYGASFYRQKFLMSAGSVSIAVIFLMISAIIGSFTVGRLVKRASEKTVLLFFTTLLGAITLFTFRTPIFWVTYVASLIACFSGGILISISSSFALGQIPEYSGTMMSLHSAADSFASAIAAGLGGSLLLVYGYELGSSAVGALGILGALVLYILTSNPKLASNP